MAPEAFHREKLIFQLRTAQCEHWWQIAPLAAQGVVYGGGASGDLRGGGVEHEPLGRGRLDECAVGRQSSAVASEAVGYAGRGLALPQPRTRRRDSTGTTTTKAGLSGAVQFAGSLDFHPAWTDFDGRICARGAYVCTPTCGERC